MAAHALLSRRTDPELVAHGAIAIGLGAMVLLVHTEHAAWLVVAALAWGIGSGTNWVLSTVSLQRLAPDEMMGRLSSMDDLVATVAIVLSAVAGGAWMAHGASTSSVVGWFVVAAAVAWSALTLHARNATATVLRDV